MTPAPRPARAQRLGPGQRPDLLGPRLRVLVVGTRAGDRPVDSPHWYAGRGTSFWLLLHAAGLTPTLLDPQHDDLLPGLGVGLTDLLAVADPADPERRTWLLDRLLTTVRRTRPAVVAFVSKTAACAYARAAGERAPKGYGALSWQVAGRPAFVLPGPSGANNGMPLPLRTALWRDLADFCELVERGSDPAADQPASG